MIKSKKLRVALMGVGAVAAMAAVLASCGGADNVASPGEGVIIGGPGGSSSSSSSSSSSAPDTCPTGTLNGGLVAGLRNCQLPNLITGTLSLDKVPGVVYSINGRVQVGDDLGANPSAPLAGAKGVLNIAPGVKLFGSAGLDYLIVSRGSQIFATGSATDPIIFTSKADIEGTTNDNSIGQWGGLVIAGRAPTNVCPAGVTPPNVACSEGQVEGTNAFYGGNTANDNSGILKYVRVQHSGFEVLPAKELNGITFAGVGSGTTVEYVQVHNSSDDGMEMFGGTVNLKRIILTGNDDDSLDTDNGYRGTIQFLIVKQRETGGDRLFEMSCAGNSAFCSHPVISNATLIRRSSVASNGLELNTGTDLTLINSVIHNTSSTTTTGIRVADAATNTAAPGFQSVFMSGFTTPFATVSGNTWAQTLFTAGSNNTSAGTTSLADFVNGTNEAGVVATNATTVNANFTNVNYIGAVKDSADTWWSGWSCSLNGVSCR
ncbi:MULTISPECIES: hypothetical protein [Asticcacaulis]|uniref:hypothetical protein n=1 Tax=Asticcacaulis TaxID=76890 RepID=UPI001FD98160|nr:MULTISPECIES: hypothetical protein [Asticcacaulis]MBP2159259.1 hypothetical protein [Asticcacaulis solisilvae]MDR6800304.1 hypothetical protein [Asticcacaulis sp. BE141]